MGVYSSNFQISHVIPIRILHGQIGVTVINRQSEYILN